MLGLGRSESLESEETKSRPLPPRLLPCVTFERVLTRSIRALLSSSLSIVSARRAVLRVLFGADATFRLGISTDLIESELSLLSSLSSSLIAILEMAGALSLPLRGGGPTRLCPFPPSCNDLAVARDMRMRGGPESSLDVEAEAWLRVVRLLGPGSLPLPASLLSVSSALSLELMASRVSWWREDSKWAWLRVCALLFPPRMLAAPLARVMGALEAAALRVAVGIFLARPHWHSADDFLDDGRVVDAALVLLSHRCVRWNEISPRAMALASCPTRPHPAQADAPCGCPLRALVQLLQVSHAASQEPLVLLRGVKARGLLGVCRGYWST